MALILSALREKRTVAITWLVGGALAMYFEAIAISAELRDYPGGGASLAKSIFPTIEGMRLIRWPADRLDTLGGYLAYHNVILFNYFFALFAAVQGARTIRYLEETRDIQIYLATGVSRAKLLWMRSLAFLLVLLIICLGTGLATALALQKSNEPDLSGSVLTLIAGGICIMPFFGLGLLLSHFFKGSRTASGLSSIIVTAIYAIGNISDKYEWLTWFKYFSPFYYANLSRPMIPGFEVNYSSWIWVSLVSLLLIKICDHLLKRRDIDGVLFEVKKNYEKDRNPSKKHFIPKRLLTDLLWRQRISIATWAIMVAAFVALFISLMSGVVDIWQKFAFLEQFTTAGFGTTPTEQYLALVYEVLPPFILGFIIFQSSTWTLDYLQGRNALFLSAPISIPRLALNRIAVILISIMGISLTSFMAIYVGSTAQNADFYLKSTFRVFLMTLLFGLAFTTLSMLIVTLLRRRIITPFISLYVGAAWLITFMAPYLKWPNWVSKLSIFDAMGHPFIEFPSSSRIIGLLIVAIPGLWLTIFIAKRLPKAA